MKETNPLVNQIRIACEGVYLDKSTQLKAIIRDYEKAIEESKSFDEIKRLYEEREGFIERLYEINKAYSQAQISGSLKELCETMSGIITSIDSHGHVFVKEQISI